MIVGGTGFYLWSFLQGFTFPKLPADAELRGRLKKELDEVGNIQMYEKLEKCDPAAAEKIHPNDTKRIIRALEVYEKLGRPISDVEKGVPAAEKYALHLVGLTMPRDKLYKRIEERIDQQIERGLIQEVKELAARGYGMELPSMQALGYKEAMEYIQGGWSKEKMISELKKRTRNFAKRQYVWFRRFPGVEWIEAG